MNKKSTDYNLEAELQMNNTVKELLTNEIKDCLQKSSSIQELSQRTGDCLLAVLEMVHPTAQDCERNYAALLSLLDRIEVLESKETVITLDAKRIKEAIERDANRIKEAIERGS